MNTLKPRPTEWHGITYRSKSEAMMALYWSSRGYCVKYEPEQFGVNTDDDDWIPDFVVWLPPDDASEVRPGHQSPDFPSLHLIEYKPSYVTTTYFNELTSRFRTVLKQHDYYDLACASLFGLLLEGSFYEDSGHRTTVFDSWYDQNFELRIRREDGWPLGEDFTQIRNYRFDLEASCSFAE